MENRFNLFVILLVVSIILGGIFYFTKSTSKAVDVSALAVKTDSTRSDSTLLQVSTQKPKDDYLDTIKVTDLASALNRHLDRIYFYCNSAADSVANEESELTYKSIEKYKNEAFYLNSTQASCSTDKAFCIISWKMCGWKVHERIDAFVCKSNDNVFIIRNSFYEKYPSIKFKGQIQNDNGENIYLVLNQHDGDNHTRYEQLYLYQIQKDTLISPPLFPKRSGIITAKGDADPDFVIIEILDGGKRIKFDEKELKFDGTRFVEL